MCRWLDLNQDIFSWFFLSSNCFSDFKWLKCREFDSNGKTIIFIHFFINNCSGTIIVISSIKIFHRTNTEIATVTPIKSILNNCYKVVSRVAFCLFFLIKINLVPIIWGSLHRCIFVIKRTTLYCHSFSIIFFLPI